ncbi:TetR/AcrR family transcriptional regulator C-terminal domain-containing protein [Thomasclavelia saccharogumia]|uniref:TetR/AcrR family transcriptional regulator C-terminal domain-containing protein n=1 Tax=Thomasclavelia saccharogumia TaxID=341225 RepID=UPI00047928E7|nr:TetR/AcrR family transcriptional regulator C-terminal domain-containing protein [Thomasclavelia saccharogumia]
MTHDEISLQTKQKLATSLKKFMMLKSLNKITVTDIIRDCNVNRKTFYYHFEDIYDLLKWILEQEAVEVVKKFDLMVDYKEAIIFVMSYIENNAHILACAYDSLGREEMRRFLYHDFTSIVETLIDNVEKELGLCVKKEFKYFVCNLYTESLAGILIEWFKNPQNRCKEQVVEYLSIIFCSSLPEIMKNAPKD